jgi:cellulose synthase/poly-beta-1,6-N-acetylglucosamine synthase-like glycosyltransferase
VAAHWASDPRHTNQTGVSAPETIVSAFTIGICATGVSSRIAELLDTIETERFPDGFHLGRIIIVASACADRTLVYLRRVRKADPRIVLVEEKERRGKAEAVNRIMMEASGEFLVFVNADAVPERGAISRLLRAIKRDPTTGIISGNPVISGGDGVASRVLELMWETHNSCSADLDESRLANHGTDELMVVRSEALANLPSGVVNDGAYIAGLAHSRGYVVRSLTSASVNVDVPTRPIEIIRQRRRILYGHLQIWRMVGEAPRTAESLILISPGLGFSVLVRTMARRPRLLVALPFAAVSELISLVGALADNLSSGQKHAVWKRYGD